MNNKDKMLNSAQRMERFLRSFSSRKRIEILLLISNQKDITLEQIQEVVGSNMKNISTHVFRLSDQGPVAKRKHKNTVEHAITHRGRLVVYFLKLMDKNI